MQAGVDPAAVYGVTLAEWMDAADSSPDKPAKVDPAKAAEGAAAFKAMMKAQEARLQR